MASARTISSQALGSSSITSTVPRVRDQRGRLRHAHRLSVVETRTPSFFSRLIRAGSETMNTEPLPSSVSTETSPPIIWQKRRLITRPRPVPPYLREVEASAWVKAWKRRPELLRGHADAGVGDAEDDPVAPAVVSRPGLETDLAVLGELGGVGEQVEQHLAHARHVRVHAVDVRRAVHLQDVLVLLDEGMDGGLDVVHQVAHVEGLEVQLHLAGLDLRQVEDVVDEGEEVLARGVDLLQVGDEVVLAGAPRPPPAASRCSR